MTAQNTAWAHLPNAKHIDWVLDSLRREPDRWDAARDAARDAAWVAAWVAARVAIAALVAWDDSADVLDMPADAVKVLVACGNQRALLLHPACIVRQNI